MLNGEELSLSAIMLVVSFVKVWFLLMSLRERLTVFRKIISHWRCRRLLLNSIVQLRDGGILNELRHIGNWCVVPPWWRLWMGNQNDNWFWMQKGNGKLWVNLIGVRYLLWVERKRLNWHLRLMPEVRTGKGRLCLSWMNMIIRRLAVLRNIFTNMKRMRKLFYKLIVGVKGLIWCS